jgi:alanyl-tRNA synthetase
MGCGSPGCAPGCDCDRYLEIWNLVFMQFERAQDGSMTRLPRPSIDTGMGLERLAAVIQKVPSNFETDAFRPLLDKISSLSGRPYLYGLRLTPEDADFQTNVSLRVVADHARAVTFLAGDGVRPDNLGRGYVLRRILRRAIRHGRKLGLDKPFMAEMAVKVIEGLSQAYPDLADQASYISKLITSEEERFIETIGSGLSLLGEAISQIKAIGASHIPGQITFKLYDTYGFPLDLVADAAREQGLSVDIAGFEAAMAEQKAKGRAAWKSSGALEKDETVSLINTLSAQGFNNFFSGYDSLEEEGQKPAMLIKGGIAAETAAEGDEVILVFPRTPFYATSGGQKGDSGRILFPNGEIRVDDTAKAPGSGLFLHQGQVVSGRVAASEEARLIVDREKREATAANHSATHLLHRALRETLGDHVRQAGSLVSSERLRFDFSHFAPVSLAELEKIESLANLYIAEDSPVQTEVMGMEKAVRSGAMALFEERYGEEVRVVTMGASRELCGGTHAERTGRIGFLAIVSESAVSAGVRRLECLTGQAALGEFQSQRRNLRKISAIMKAKPEELPERIQKQANRIKELERSPKAQAGADNPAALAAESQKLENGLTFLAAKVSAPDPKSLRELGDLVRERMGPGYLLALASESLEGKALLLVTADKSVCSRLKSGDIIAGMAKAVGGKGGGRPDLAQAGGPDIQGIPKALALAREMVLNSLKNETV